MGSLAKIHGSLLRKSKYLPHMLDPMVALPDVILVNAYGICP
jgi:hypothetical protein